MSTEPITVGYWSTRGLGAPLRMMVMYSGTPLNNVNYNLRFDAEKQVTSVEWADAKEEMKARNPLMNLPYLEIPSQGLLVNQTNACLLTLGRYLNMMGSNLKENVDVEQLLCETTDLRSTLGRFSYGFDDVPAEKYLPLLIGTGKCALIKLEIWISRQKEANGNCTFFVGNSATAADFHIWDAFDQMVAVMTTAGIPQSTLEETLPCLFAFHREFAALPQNQKYLSSKLATLPCTNLIAKYCSAINNESYVPGAPAPWQENLSGIY